MKKVQLRNVSVNDRLAVDIRIESPLPDVQYRIRIDRGTELKPRHLNRLKEEGIRSIFVTDPATSDLNDYLYDEKLKEVEGEIVKELQQSAKAIRDGRVYQISSEKLSSTIDNLIEALVETSASMAYTSLKSHADYLPKHEFDVGKLTLHLILVYEDELLNKYSNETSQDTVDREKFLRNAGLGAILHDMGNWKIPEETLQQSTSLTEVEWEAIERHPRLGYKMLRELDDFPNIAAIPALHHHERFSGDGYPDGRSGKDIHFLGRLVAICDVYSALTSERPYRVELTPNRAIQTMTAMQEEDEAFDSDLFNKFLNIIPPYPIGQDVVMSDGTRGVVCDLEEGFETPKVRILYNGENKIDKPYEIVANANGNPEILN